MNCVLAYCSIWKLMHSKISFGSSILLCSTSGGFILFFFPMTFDMFCTSNFSHKTSVKENIGGGWFPPNRGSPSWLWFAWQSEILCTVLHSKRWEMQKHWLLTKIQTTAGSLLCPITRWSQFIFMVWFFFVTYVSKHSPDTLWGCFCKEPELLI